MDVVVEEIEGHRSADIFVLVFPQSLEGVVLEVDGEGSGVQIVVFPEHLVHPWQRTGGKLKVHTQLLIFLYCLLFANLETLGGFRLQLIIMDVMFRHDLWGWVEIVWKQECSEKRDEVGEAEVVS